MATHCRPAEHGALTLRHGQALWLLNELGFSGGVTRQIQ